MKGVSRVSVGDGGSAMVGVEIAGGIKGGIGGMGIVGMGTGLRDGGCSRISWRTSSFWSNRSKRSWTGMLRLTWERMRRCMRLQGLSIMVESLRTRWALLGLRYGLLRTRRDIDVHVPSNNILNNRCPDCVDTTASQHNTTLSTPHARRCSSPTLSR